MNTHAERLHGIVDALEVQDMFRHSRQHIRNAADEIERLQAQVEELKKDKARLDWLASKIVCHSDTKTSDNWCWYNSPVTEDNNLVEAIDKAMEQTK